MKSSLKMTAFIMAASIMLAGCQNRNTQTSDEPENSESEVISSQSSESQSSEVSESEAPDKVNEKVTLYVGTQDNFRTFDTEIDEELTPDILIEEISKLTGWNLDMSEPVATGKGGMTVTFSSECALVKGPPEPQKDDFFVYDSIGLAQSVLDSIKETLAQNFVSEPGDPSELDVYFSIEGENINIPDMGREIPFDKPYDSKEIFG